MNEIVITYMDGPKVEIKGSDLDTKYKICFYNDITNELVYRSEISSTYWSAASPKYYVPWHITVDDGHAVRHNRLDLKGKKVLIVLSSKSLGDNVAWARQVEEFQRIHECDIYIATFWNDLLEKAYPSFTFVGHGQELNQYTAMYVLGAYDRDFNRNKNDWRFIPLQQIASDILGLPNDQLQPRVVRSVHPRPLDKPYICISEFSTWLAKQWIYPDGWNEIIHRINERGYRVVSISKEPTALKGVLKQNNMPIEETVRWMQYADAMVTVSNGLSVVAWALNIPTVMVSGCTGDGLEFDYAKRVSPPKGVCQGCMNDQRYKLDRGNWRYCPANRDFICSRSITPDMVWERLSPLLPDVSTKLKEVMPSVNMNEIAKRDVRGGDLARILFITPHCSTGGGPQYVLKCVEKMKQAGHEIQVVEYNNISDTYIVQRNKIKSLVPYYILNGNKREHLHQIITDFRPDIVHMHEFAENLLSEDVAKILYNPNRNYKIIETVHGISIGPDKKRYRPDAFAFVSQYHADLFKEYGVPIQVVEYQANTHTRPERSAALAGLGLDPCVSHILNVGLFTPDKNQSEIFEIAQHLSGVQFHFVGNMAVNFRSYWEPLLLNRPDNCRLWGEQTDVDKFYAAMDKFLFTSKRELNPLVIKEALSWQMPVFMRNLPSYCGKYNNEPLVTFIDDDIELTCRLLQPRTMILDLEAAYRVAGNSLIIGGQHES